MTKREPEARADPAEVRPTSSPCVSVNLPTARPRVSGLSRLALAGALTTASFASGVAWGGDVTVAFIGDQGARQEARDVLSLIAAADVDLLVSGGDLGYGLGPESWIANVDEILGSDFPVLAAVGNHEGKDWPRYQRWLEARVGFVDDLQCDGEVGVKAHCTFRGISIVQTAPGVHEVPGVAPEDGYPDYLAQELAASPNVWRICSWHKLMRDMQVGGKTDATGWGIYEACREGGGIAATAHEHSYSRTHLMSSFENREVVHRNDHLEIGPGRSFAFVSGLGGRAVRAQQRDGDWWASIYSATQGATHGALFCTFGERTAECRFEDIVGGVPDRFTLESSNAQLDPSPSDEGAASEEGDADARSDAIASVDEDAGAAQRIEESPQAYVQADEQPVEQPNEQLGEQPDEQPVEPPDEQPDAQADEQPDEQPVEPPDEQPDAQADEQLDEQADEQPDARADEQPDEQPVEQPDVGEEPRAELSVASDASAIGELQVESPFDSPVDEEVQAPVPATGAAIEGPASSDLPDVGDELSLAGSNGFFPPPLPTGTLPTSDVQPDIRGEAAMGLAIRTTIAGETSITALGVSDDAADADADAGASGGGAASGLLALLAFLSFGRVPTGPTPRRRATMY